MKNIMNTLQGKRTYILGAIGLITTGLYLMGYIDANTANTILALCGFGGMITLRAAIK